MQIMLTLLELQRKQFLSTIVNFSTSEVYGDLGHQEYFDTRSPMKPLTAYAAGKAFPAAYAVRGFIGDLVSKYS